MSLIYILKDYLGFFMWSKFQQHMTLIPLNRYARFLGILIPINRYTRLVNIFKAGGMQGEGRLDQGRVGWSEELSWRGMRTLEWDQDLYLSSMSGCKVAAK